MWITDFIIQIIEVVRPQAVWKSLWKSYLPVEKASLKLSFEFSTTSKFQQPVEMWKTLFKFS